MGTEIFLFLNIGTSEMMLILVVALFLFGGKKLPELARGLGRGIREFKDASETIKKDISEQINNFEEEIDVVKSDVKSITQGVLEEENKVEEVIKISKDVSTEEHPVNLAHQNDIDHSDQYYKNYDYDYPEEDVSGEPLDEEPILEEKIVSSTSEATDDTTNDLPNEDSVEETASNQSESDTQKS